MINHEDCYDSWSWYLSFIYYLVFVQVPMNNECPGTTRYHETIDYWSEESEDLFFCIICLCNINTCVQKQKHMFFTFWADGRTQFYSNCQFGTLSGNGKNHLQKGSLCDNDMTSQQCR